MSTFKRLLHWLKLGKPLWILILVVAISWALGYAISSDLRTQLDVTGLMLQACGVTITAFGLNRLRQWLGLSGPGRWLKEYLQRLVLVWQPEAVKADVSAVDLPEKIRAYGCSLPKWSPYLPKRIGQMEQEIGNVKNQLADLAETIDRKEYRLKESIRRVQVEAS